jgi:putative phage-type endonuclease
MKEYAPILVPLEQRSQEWISFREGKIGASDAPAIMGVSPWKTKLQLWEEKILGTKKASTPSMERGTKYEPEALAWFNSQVKDLFTPETYQHGIHHDIIASLDGFNGEVNVELKIPSKFSSDFPEHYMPQLQHQMMVLGTDFTWYAEYSPDLRKGWYAKIERDDDYIHELLASELAFLASLIDLRAPEPSDKDWAQIDDPELLLASKGYKHISYQIDELERQKDELKKKLIGSGNNNRMRCGELKIQKIYRKGNLDYAKMIEDYKITGYERYRKESIETWRIT